MRLQHQHRPRRRQRPPPTPEEIRERCAAIRARWDVRTEARRRGWRGRGEPPGWLVPLVKLAGVRDVRDDNDD